MDFAKPIEELIYQLSRLPGIGRKSAQRTAFYILEMGEERVEALIRALGEVQRTIHPCKRCNSLTEGDLCIVCLDDEREKSKLCLVEDTKEMAAIESTGKFDGYYFVLGGLLSPIKKIGPEEIHIPMLEEILDEGNITEIIMAVSPTIEGQTTSLFISDLVKDRNIQVTELAQGIAIGSSLEYYDAFTLSKAFDQRRIVE